MRFCTNCGAKIKDNDAFCINCGAKQKQVIPGALKNSSDRRPFKGMSLVAFPREYIALDIETTGLDPSYDEIIEVCAIHIKDGIAIDTYCRLINIGRPLDPLTVYLTGITDDMLEKAPPATHVLRCLYQYIGGHIIVGHNVNFDINFCYDAFDQKFGLQFSNNYVDTLRLARRLFPDLPHHRLSDLCEYFKINQQYEHRAFADAMYTSFVFEKMREHIAANNIQVSDLIPKKRQYLPSSSSKTVVLPSNEEPDPSSAFYKKTVVFTGVLEEYDRKYAMQLVRNLGGICADRITKSTDILVVGGIYYRDDLNSGKKKSTKVLAAEKLIMSGSDMQIITEKVFYDMIRNEES